MMANLPYRDDLGARLLRQRLMLWHRVLAPGVAIMVFSGCSPHREERTVQRHGGNIVASNIDGYSFTAAFPDATDDTLASIGRMDPLMGLDLSGSAISDTGLAYLARMNSLQVLVLSNTRVTDDGMRHLASLPKLTRLVLSNTHITDAAARDIPEWVWWLDLRGTRMTDKGVSLIASRLDNLIYLDLSETAVSDEGVRAIANAKWSWFDTILLDETGITEESIALLCQGFEMRGLSLRNTDVTDALIDHLLAEASLRELNLEGSRVTEAGLARLRNERADIEPFKERTRQYVLFSPTGG